ncbi:hypothetical protein [Parapedobacter sp. DT-150]|uniref:hypothetical protein n=1 Tax=Parapedobacter sp. DT-150 TaxID=3396162 RepID=UPI003F1B9E3E
MAAPKALPEDRRQWIWIKGLFDKFTLTTFVSKQYSHKANNVMEKTSAGCEENIDLETD